MADPGSEQVRNAGGVLLCGACRAIGDCRLGVIAESMDEAGVAHYDLFCPADQEGGPGVAHGGWTAGVLDELLGHVPILHGQMTVTGTLTIRFVKPVPVDRPLVGRAWVDRRERKKWMISGEIALGSSGAILASATGVWVERDPGMHFGGFQQWLADQEDRPA